MGHVFIVDKDHPGVNAQLDASTGAIATIEYEHHEIHSGSSYMAWAMQKTSNADDKSTTVTLTTPNTTKWFHLIPFGETTGEAHFIVKEGVTIGTKTSDVTAYNRNRNSTKTSAGTLQYFDEDATGEVTGGTQIYHEHLGAGRTSADATTGRDEIILKQNESYSFVIENEGAAANIHNIILNWYEHTDKR